VGSDRDHARRRTLFQPVQEQISKEKRREVIEGERVLQPINGDMAGVPLATDVLTSTSILGRRYSISSVSRRTSTERTGPPEHVDVPAAHCADLPSGFLHTRGIAAGDREVRAQLARPNAVALPMPPLAQVTSTVLPAIRRAAALFHVSLLRIVAVRGQAVALPTTGEPIMAGLIGSEPDAAALQPLAISHTPAMKISHRPPGSVWISIKLTPRTSNTGPHRMTAYRTSPQTARTRGSKWAL